MDLEQFGASLSMVLEKGNDKLFWVKWNYLSQILTFFAVITALHS